MMQEHSESRPAAKPEHDRGSSEPRVIGDPRLHQVKDFLDEQAPPPANPMLVVLRSFRGRGTSIAVLAVLMSVLFGVGAYLAISPKYQSQGLIRVAARVPKVMYADPNDPRLRLFDSFVSAEVTYLQSRPVLERALGVLAEETHRSDEPIMDISDLSRMISVQKDKGLITVSALAPQPEQASNTVNTLLQAYTSLHNEASSQAQTIRESQLIGREKELLAKLTETNANILEVGGEHGTASIAKAHLNKVTQLEDVDHRVSELVTTIAQQEAEESSTAFDTGDAEIKRVIVLDKAMADMTYDRAKRSAALASLRLRYKDDHLSVVALETEIGVIDNAIEARRQQIVTLGNTGALTAGGENQEKDSLKGLRALSSKLQTRRLEVAIEAKRLNSKLIELTFLKEEHGEVRKMLDATRRALEEVRVESRNSLPGSVEVIAYGGTPKRPVEDKRKKLAVAGAGFGFISAFALFTLGSLLSSRLRYSDDLAFAIGESTVLSVLPGSDQSEELFKKSVHRMRNRLQLKDEVDRGHGHTMLLAVCAAHPGSGASTVAQELAKSFCVAGLHTVLVDGDLNEPALSQRMNLGDMSGLRDAISAGRLDRSSHLQETSHLHVLPAGHDSTVCDEHLSLSRVRTVVDELCDIYQVVVIDVGAFENNLSANLITALADQVLVVVRAGEQASSLRRVLKWLESDATRPPLLAFNAANENDPGLIKQGTHGSHV
jgi:succinoglycan biosynthesis transport protein ExoP